MQELQRKQKEAQILNDRLTFLTHKSLMVTKDEKKGIQMKLHAGVGEGKLKRKLSDRPKDGMRPEIEVVDAPKKAPDKQLKQQARGGSFSGAGRGRPSVVTTVYDMPPPPLGAREPRGRS